MNTATREVPNIQQPPRTANDTAIHYGYCAFHDISLTGSLGHEHYVQPANSPYYQILPAGELIPFTNIEIMEQRSSGNQLAMTAQDAMVWTKVQKTAGECVREMENSKEEWGFVVFTPLTGLPEDEAFHAFQAVQPFRYKFAHLLDELDNAEDRIARAEPYTVSYNGQSFAIDPLPPHLKKTAREVLALMRRSADKGVSLATEIADATEISLVNRFSGGDGKRTPDPRDKYVFDQLERNIPKLLDPRGGNSGNNTGTMSADEIALRRDELAVKREDIALRKAELAAKNGVIAGQMETTNPVAVTPPNYPDFTPPVLMKCGDTGGLNVRGEPCKVNATKDGRCANHQREAVAA